MKVLLVKPSLIVIRDALFCFKNIKNYIADANDDNDFDQCISTIVLY